MAKCPICDGTGTSNTCVNGHFKTCEYCNGTGEVFQCPKCGEITYMNNIGSLFDHDYAWYRIECPKCGYFSDGGTDPKKAIDMFVKGLGDIPKPLTEQEYIQTCNTEQLAEVLFSWYKLGRLDVINKHTEVKKDWLKEWLKQPHKGVKMLDNEFKKSAMEKVKSMDSNELKKAFKEIGSEPETNEEWFDSLSTKEKAEWLFKLTYKCYWCGREYTPRSQSLYNEKECPFKKCMKDKKDFENWLKQPHTFK